MIDAEYLVTLNVPIALEATVVDCLLLLEVKGGFSSFPVSAHHHEHHSLSLMEQVTGRHKEIRFQIHVPQPDLDNLLSHLRKEFTGCNIQYWVMPVVVRGVL